MDPLHILDSAMAEAVRKGGPWIVCRPGCTSCCLGPFDITPADASRLREGLAQLDPLDAAGIRARALAFDNSEDVPCPVLDIDSGLCRLYAHRPLMCRTFGPATRIGDDIGTCHLCFDGATDDEIAAAAVPLDPAFFDSPSPLTIAEALAR